MTPWELHAMIAEGLFSSPPHSMKGNTRINIWSVRFWTAQPELVGVVSWETSAIICCERIQRRYCLKEIHFGVPRLLFFNSSLLFRSLTGYREPSLVCFQNLNWLQKNLLVALYNLCCSLVPLLDCVFLQLAFWLRIEYNRNNNLKTILNLFCFFRSASFTLKLSENKNLILLFWLFQKKKMSNLNGEEINSNATVPTANASFAGMFNVSAVPHTIPQAVPLQTVVRHTAASEKPPKFAGTEFKLWQQKMHFYLTTLQLVKYLKEVCPAVPTETPDDRDALMAIDVWHNGDYLCRNYILSCLHDSLYGIYVGIKTSKELWESLEKKYKMEDAGTKKFVVTKFLEYVMTDSKTVVSQAEEFQKILHEIEAEGMVLSESFQVAAMIDKLPPRWKDFKNYLKHKRKEMTLENLIVRLCIEENNKKSEGKQVIREVEPKANIVENSKRLSGTKRKEYGSSSNTKRPEAKRSEKRTFVGKCFNCQKTGHRATECRSKKRPPQANLAVVENLASDVSHMHLSAVVSEVNLATNVKDWWVDTGATRHICADRELFSKYEKLEENERLFMGNSAISNVVGKGEVILKFTSGVELTLMDVFHVPDIRKNLISGCILSKKGFKMVFESDKFVLTKAGMFLGYLIDGLFKENAIVIDKQSKFLYPQIINKTKSSAYLLESSDLWHGRLGHANLHALKKMAHLGLIPNFDIDKNHKCEICVEAKFAKPPFKSVERTSKPLELIHSDICDLKYVQ